MFTLLKGALTATFLVTAAALGLAGCSDDKTADAHGPDHDHGGVAECDLPASCLEIMVACHPKDLGEGNAVSDCHAIAHEDGTQAACDAKHDECVELCDSTPLPEGSAPYEPDCGDPDHDHAG